MCLSGIQTRPCLSIGRQASTLLAHKHTASTDVPPFQAPDHKADRLDHKEELICCKYFALYHQPSESFLDESSQLLSVSSFLDELAVPYQASGLVISRQFVRTYYCCLLMNWHSAWARWVDRAKHLLGNPASFLTWKWNPDAISCAQENLCNLFHL
jgi:hypothetical protein